jgi:DNA-binding NtrC family response regulator
MVLNGNRVIIVEDLQEELSKYLRFAVELGMEAKGVSLASQAIQLLNEEGFDFILTDMNLLDTKTGMTASGYDIITHAVETQPNIVVLAMTADPTQEMNTKVFKLGANHFFRKPLHTKDEFVINFELAIKQKRSGLYANKKSELLRNTTSRVFKIGADVQDNYPNGIVISEFHEKVAIAVAKNKKIPVILFGETGTGKEEFAKIIHQKRIREEGIVPFVAVNCAELNSEISASILFGHKKGAFSGADATTVGFIAEANGGVLFLDEVHTLDLSTQRKLLRVLNDGSYYRVGDTRVAHSFFQPIAATTVDLDSEVEAGRFLPDLRNRLTGVDVYLEPLSKRLNDIHLLIASFFFKKNIDISDSLFDEIVQKCKQCAWNGNIRQLIKILDSMLIMAEVYDEPLAIHHLQTPKNYNKENDLIVQIDDKKETLGHIDQKSSCVTLLEKALKEDYPLSDLMDTIEKEVLLQALNRHKTFSELHDALDISRSAMDGKRRKYKL